MHEILAPLVSGVVRFFLGLFEFLGLICETDFRLTDGFFSAKTLTAVCHRVQRRRGASGALQEATRALLFAPFGNPSAGEGGEKPYFPKTCRQSPPS